MIRNRETRWGQCYYFGKDEYVGKSIHYYGEYNPDETERILELAREAGGTVLDIGANIGCISQALVYSGIEVVAFEPQPEVFNLLKRNIPNSLVYNCAIGSVQGTAKMPKIRYDDHNNVGGMSLNTSGVLGTITVPVETIDSFQFNNIGLIKIDVEGFEKEVLEGARETIMRCKPILYIEDDRPHLSQALYETLDSLGYTNRVEHQPPLYRKENYLNLEKNIWNVNYVSKNIECRYVND